MFKQYIAILFLCISSFILVGHSIIPHQHVGRHDHHKVDSITEHSKSEHHHHHHHNGNHHKKHTDEQPSGLADLLAFVNHSSEYLTNNNNLHEFEQRLINDHLKADVCSFNTPNEIVPTIIKGKPIYYRDPDYYPPPNSHKGLRAPPVFFS